MEVLDQGEQINEVWVILRFPLRDFETERTRVFPRDTLFGQALLELALAQ